jgi:hypothetical protein
MRLSEWRKAAPKEGVLDDSVLAIVNPVLADLGAEPDPECWVAWGEDPDVRYSLLSPTPAGLITLAIRFTTQEDGVRVIAKLVRWSKVSVSELGVEAGGGHRIVAVQVENIVLKGIDNEADQICEFVRGLIAGVDDRLQSPVAIKVVGSVAPMVAAPSAVAPRVSVRNVSPASVVIAPRGAVPVALPAAADVAADPGPNADLAPKTPKVARPAAPKAAPAPTTLVPVVAAAGAAPKVVKPAAPKLVPPVPMLTAGTASGVQEGTAPTPIASRAAARLGAAEVDPTVPPNPPDGGSEPEPDRSGWVSPHAIEAQPTRKPSKPRTWMP